MGEVEGDTTDLNVARMTAERFMDWAPKGIHHWPKMTLASLASGLPPESLPCPRVQFGTSDFTTGPTYGLTCVITTSIFDDKGALIFRHETKYNSSERGRTPPGAVPGVLVLDLINFYRKEMQNAADYVASDLIQNLR